MIPTYPFSLSSSSSSFNSNSTMPIIDLNIVDDHQSHEQIFSPTHQPSYSSSCLSSSSCPILFNPSHQLQDHAGSSYLEYKNLQNDHEEACGKNIIGSSGGSWNDPDQVKGGGGGGVEIRKRGLKLKVWKRSSAASGSSEKEEDEENNHNHNQTEDNYDSMKWMPSKMRMMRKMMVASSDHNHNNNDKVSSSSSSEDQNQNQYRNQQRALLLSPRGNDNSTSSNNSSTHCNTNNSIITVRVCADCHTTKTPLWRSGPRGPKSLCNACGIRQRKARRAMAAAAAAAASNGGSPDLKAAEKSAVKRSCKVHRSKEKKLKFERETTHHQIMKKKHKVEDDEDHQDREANNNNSSGKSPSSSPSMINKFSSFEDFTVSLMSKNLATSSQVFPQDEKEAAILLMALSFNGLVHG